MEDLFDRLYKTVNRFFASDPFYAGMTVLIGLLALTATLTAILEPMPALTRGTLLGIVVVLWIFTLAWLNWWRKWRVVAAWKQEREALQRKVERVNAYFEKVDAGELPDGPIPPEIRQDLRDVLADWRRELLRQEGLEIAPNRNRKSED